MSAARTRRPPSALIVLGDQPRSTVDTIRALVDAAPDAARPIVVPRYADDRGRNPVLLASRGLRARRGGGRRSRSRPGPGGAPGARPGGRCGRRQPGCRHPRATLPALAESPPGAIGSAPTASRSTASARSPTARTSMRRSGRCSAPIPTRTDDPVLDASSRSSQPGDTWLDVGAGAGRFALPIARALAPSGGRVIALDASASMLEAPCARSPPNTAS